MSFNICMVFFVLQIINGDVIYGFEAARFHTTKANGNYGPKMILKKNHMTFKSLLLYHFSLIFGVQQPLVTICFH